MAASGDEPPAATARAAEAAGVAAVGVESAGVQAQTLDSGIRKFWHQMGRIKLWHQMWRIENDPVDEIDPYMKGSTIRRCGKNTHKMTKTIDVGNFPTYGSVVDRV
jgi:hypothetical protein